MPMRAMLTIVLLIGAVGAQAAPPPSQIELPANGRAIVRAELDGKPVTLRVDLDGPRLVMLNPAAAARLGLKEGLLSKIAALKPRVGAVKLRARIARKPLVIAGKRSGVYAVWFERDYAPGVDGVISAALLPYDVVRFRGDAPLTGRTSTVPVKIDWGGISTSSTLGAVTTRASMSLSRPQSATSATGGQLFERNAGAVRVGGVRDVEIAFGIPGPMQRYRLPRPATIGAVRLSEVDVRTTRGAPTDDPDPDEIVVQAKSKKPPSLIILSVGREALASCGSITFDRRARTLGFDCS